MKSRSIATFQSVAVSGADHARAEMFRCLYPSTRARNGPALDRSALRRYITHSPASLELSEYRRGTNKRTQLAIRDEIDKDRLEPAYAQLAAIIMRQIAQGAYPPGTKIPSETYLTKRFGLSTMTVRQAIGVLIEQGIVERVHGSGTFVKNLRFVEAQFDLNSLRQVFQDLQHNHVKVLDIRLERSDEETAKKLQLSPGDRVILIRRLLLRDDSPVIILEGRIRCDPKRPLVETELGLGPLSDLFSSAGGASAKKGELSLFPAVLSEDEAALLGRPLGSLTLRMEYLVYDFDDLPFGWGSVTPVPEVISLSSKVGLWNEP